jgi:prevent-host-death family protein
MPKSRRKQVHETSSLETVTTSELSRSPMKVLDRVQRGERLVICRHGLPLATLQPLDGFVLQHTGEVTDVYGHPADPVIAETEKLDEVQRELLQNAIRHGRIIPSNAKKKFPYERMREAMAELGLLGLAKRENRGWELTGRGFMFHEALVRRAERGRDP